MKSALASMDGILLRIRFQEDEELLSTRQKIFDMLLHEASIRKMAFDYGGIFDVDKGNEVLKDQIQEIINIIDSQIKL